MATTVGVGEGAPANSLVFMSPSGAELRATNFARRVFHPAVERCQALDPGFPSIVFRDLRRTAVTLAVSAGANVKMVQQIAGHGSAAITLDVYAQLFAHDGRRRRGPLMPAECPCGGHMSGYGKTGWLQNGYEKPRYPCDLGE
ncbi:tyrosine-type recombinase/integrase [Arthrobacter sp. ZGTC131]|uniref:tyrosine-type recombinase/integrase n=1 Tax=Arthrobacter sp. ZGTC131 TaxID=2058898 RepID=UPI000CE37C1E|nr:tyrosine-type recombinase/integrase [Arthrobacter sp. ZGTC131]